MNLANLPCTLPSTVQHCVAHVILQARVAPDSYAASACLRQFSGGQKPQVSSLKQILFYPKDPDPSKLAILRIQPLLCRFKPFHLEGPRILREMHFRTPAGSFVVKLTVNLGDGIHCHLRWEYMSIGQN